MPRAGCDWAAARAASSRTAAAWWRSAPRRALEGAFDLAAADDLARAELQARALLADDGWVGALLAPLIKALGQAPLIDPPLRVTRTGGRTLAVLLDHPAARVTASILSMASLAVEADEVVLSGRVSLVRYVRAGGVTLTRWRGVPAAEPFLLHEAPPVARVGRVLPVDGRVLRVDGRCEGNVLSGAATDVVTLTAALHAGKGPLTRAYATADGGIRRVCSTDEGGSRAAMLLTLLRVAGRRDAGTVFAQATHDPAFHQRWGAMREWLALDAGAAWPRLEEMAAHDPHPEVRAAAAAVVVRLSQRQAA